MARNSLVPFGFGGLDPILSLHRDMNRLFDDVVRGGGRNLTADQEQPAFISASMNVAETENELRVSVELPGVAEQDIDVSLDDDVLTVRGEKKLEAERGGEKESFHYMERSYGSFQRSLRLPFTANPDEVRAAFHNGVLTITVPKAAEQRRSRKIQVQGAAGEAGKAQIEQNRDVTEKTKGTDRAESQGSTADGGGATPADRDKSQGAPGAEQAATH